MLVVLNDCDEELTAVFMHSSRFLMKTGIFRAPGDFRILDSWVMVCSRICGGQMSILVMTTMTGTLSARAMPRCSLDEVSHDVFLSRPALYVLAHTDHPVVRSHHEETVVRLTGKQAEDGSAQVPLVARQISEANHFRL